MNSTPAEAKTDELAKGDHTVLLRGNRHDEAVDLTPRRLSAATMVGLRPNMGANPSIARHRVHSGQLERARGWRLCQNSAGRITEPSAVAGPPPLGALAGPNEGPGGGAPAGGQRGPAERQREGGLCVSRYL
jgi:hypothetical protein